MWSRFNSNPRAFADCVQGELAGAVQRHERHRDVSGNARDVDDGSRRLLRAWRARPPACRRSRRKNSFRTIRAWRTLPYRRRASRMPTPALFTHTSTRSKVCSVSASARSISSRLRTSQARASVRSEWPTRWRAASARLASRDSNTTLAPSSAKTLAIASPIPMEAPVTTTTFPSISMATLVSRAARQVKQQAVRISCQSSVVSLQQNPIDPCVLLTTDELRTDNLA